MADTYELVVDDQGRTVVPRLCAHEKCAYDLLAAVPSPCPGRGWGGPDCVLELLTTIPAASRVVDGAAEGPEEPELPPVPVRLTERVEIRPHGVSTEELDALRARIDRTKELGAGRATAVLTCEACDDTGYVPIDGSDLVGPCTCPKAPAAPTTVERPDLPAPFGYRD